MPSDHQIHMTAAEQVIREKSVAFARDNKKRIARQLTDANRYPSEEEPVALFMAGSPGAGKTETAEAFLHDLGGSTLLIDPDKYRVFFEGYDGKNAWLFQPAVSIIVEKVIDMAFKNRQSFILDGTLTNYEKAKSNIERCLNKNRFVQILYVYQQPKLAWQFGQAREAQEGRRIRLEDFIDQYFEARSVVNRLKAHFGKRIEVDLMVKNLDNSLRSYKMNIDVIDRYVPENFTREFLVQNLPAPEKPL